MIECEQRLIDALEHNITKCVDTGCIQEKKKLVKFKKEIIKLWQKEQNSQEKLTKKYLTKQRKRQKKSM